MPTSILNIGITTNKKKGMPIIIVYIRYIRTLLSIINLRISYINNTVKRFDSINQLVYKLNNYERLLFIINILCNHGNTKLLGSLVQWCFDLMGVAIKEGRDK